MPTECHIISKELPRLYKVPALCREFAQVAEITVVLGNFGFPEDAEGPCRYRR